MTHVTLSNLSAVDGRADEDLEGRPGQGRRVDVRASNETFEGQVDSSEGGEQLRVVDLVRLGARD